MSMEYYKYRTNMKSSSKFRRINCVSCTVCRDFTATTKSSPFSDEKFPQHLYRLFSLQLPFVFYAVGAPSLFGAQNITT